MSETYIKIDTLWKRREGKKGAVIPNDFSNPVFPNIINWIATEKIDGENCRIMYNGETKKIVFAGKTDDAVFHPESLTYLQKTFTIEKFKELPNFDDETNISIFCELCHRKIRNSVNYLDKDELSRVVIFDVKIGNWWLEQRNIDSIAAHFHVSAAAVRMIGTIDRVIEYVISEAPSVHSRVLDVAIEGLVCTPFPPVLNRDGSPVKFKLKVEDFRKLKAIGEEYKP